VNDFLDGVSDLLSVLWIQTQVWSVQMSVEYVQPLPVSIRDIKPVQQALHALVGAVPGGGSSQQQDPLPLSQKTNSQMAAQKSGSTGNQDGLFPG
jgi:hypothetical protein